MSNKMKFILYVDSNIEGSVRASSISGAGPTKWDLGGDECYVDC